MFVVLLDGKKNIIDNAIINLVRDTHKNAICDYNDIKTTLSKYIYDRGELIDKFVYLGFSNKKYKIILIKKLTIMAI